jgi:type IV secretory pathway VirB4 component
MRNSSAIMEFEKKKKKVNIDDALLLTSSIDIISQILKYHQTKFQKIDFSLLVFC